MITKNREGQNTGNRQPNPASSGAPSGSDILGALLVGPDGNGDVIRGKFWDFYPSRKENFHILPHIDP